MSFLSCYLNVDDFDAQLFIFTHLRKIEAFLESFMLFPMLRQMRLAFFRILL